MTDNTGYQSQGQSAESKPYRASAKRKPAECVWCLGFGRVTAAPVHHGHEIEDLRIRISCPVCRGTGRDEPAWDGGDLA